MPTTELDTRSEALQLLQIFAQRILPGAIRRIAAWQNLPLLQVRDLCAEVRQELAVDCLENPALVTALPPRQRHARWLRATERWIYHQRSARACQGLDLDELTAPAPTAEAAPIAPAPPEAAAAPTAPSVSSAIALGNGRCNAVASAAGHGRSARWVRQHFDRLADQLGFGETYHAFWRRRLGEAFTGLAADLLRADDRVCVLPARHAAVDITGRLRRIRRLALRFAVRRSTLDVRRMLRPLARRPRFDASSPRRLLEQATRLHPEAGPTWLWLFEACLAERDLRGAAVALRRCRRSSARGSPALVLARARLLEAHGRLPGALALLRRAHDRTPYLRTFGAPLQDALTAATHESAVSAVCSASPS